MWNRQILAFALAAVAAPAVTAAPQAADIPVNYDEARATPLVLPDPLVAVNGRRVTDAQTWRSLRRPELLELLGPA